MGFIIKKLPQVLDVVAVVSNPAMYRSRYRLFQEFVHYWNRQIDTRLWIVELALGNRPHELTEHGNPYHLQLRSDSELWHKENLINLGVQQIGRVHPEWSYVAWIDADLQFADRHVAQSTMQALQIHPVVQMYSHAQDLDFRNRPVPDEYGNIVFESFAFRHQNRILSEQVSGCDPYAELGHCGYAWACTREAFAAIGGLLDICIVGSADWEMAMGLVGRIRQAHPRGISDNYSRTIWQWGENAWDQFKGDLGCVDGLVHHYWHGNKRERGYISRWNILLNSAFDPVTDIRRDHQGLWTLTGNKPHLRDGIRKYFRQRNEDSVR